MVNSKKHREFDNWDDDDLRSNIFEKYGYFNQEQYEFSKRLKMIIINGNYKGKEFATYVGLSENAMKTLAMLNHNIEEIQDLMDPMEVSNVHKNKLDIFSSFIADISNFSMFLTQIESYVRTKQKINETNNDKEKEFLEYDLIRN